MISIIDYGLGNIIAFANLYKRLNIPCSIASKPEDLDGATKIILPGVGAFDHAMTLLNQSGMRGTLDHLVLERNVPVLGICIGMQIQANSSEEGTLPGLGWIDGDVVKMHQVKSPSGKTLLPHMGWNSIHPVGQNKLFHEIPDESRYYFLHSYCYRCRNDEDVIAVAKYGQQFTCAINSGNIYGVQFHPEKSHHNGIQLLKNFWNL